MEISLDYMREREILEHVDTILKNGLGLTDDENSLKEVINKSRIAQYSGLTFTEHWHERNCAWSTSLKNFVGELVMKKEQCSGEVRIPSVFNGGRVESRSVKFSQDSINSQLDRINIISKFCYKMSWNSLEVVCYEGMHKKIIKDTVEHNNEICGIIKNLVSFKEIFLPQNPEFLRAWIIDVIYKMSALINTVKQGDGPPLLENSVVASISIILLHKTGIPIFDLFTRNQGFAMDLIADLVGLNRDTVRNIIRLSSEKHKVAKILHILAYLLKDTEQYFGSSGNSVFINWLLTLKESNMTAMEQLVRLYRYSNTDDRYRLFSFLGDQEVY